MREFDLIATYFTPLAKGFPGSLHLNDDAALLSPPPGCELVVTTDAMGQGVHFIGTETPQHIAQKLLRTNLSDLAAMGATPLAYTLVLHLPRDTTEAWIQAFASGLRLDQVAYGIHLIGGDTVMTHGPLACSITAFGAAPKGQALKRSHAKPGDTIYVSGTLGDSALGLYLLQQPGEPQDAFLANRYELPQPRTMLGAHLLGIANACMDISDGLLQDLGHICAASGIGAAIYQAQLPLSTAAKAVLTRHPELLSKIYADGDDYELLFTAPADRHSSIQDLSGSLSLAITAIGSITEGNEVVLYDDSGKAIATPSKGFQHF